jgi:molecular chaperone DnaJ
MAEKRDYYEVLEVSRSASAEGIRRAYRKLARKYHPDVNTDNGAEETFKEINEAYEVLNDPERRAAYDRFGHADVGAGMGGFGAGAGADPFGFAGSPFADLFESFFGGATTRTRRGPARGADLEAIIDLEFEEAVFGTEKDIEITRLEVCEACRGSRMRDGAEPPVCSTCQGTGEVRRIQRTMLGQFVTSTVCGACGGEGHVVTYPCPDCRGRGRVACPRTITVTIPAGVDEDSTLRLTGQGEQMPNGVPGNLYVHVRIRRHAVFTRQGRQIYLDLLVNMAQAALGAEVEIPTVDGPVTFKVPPGTQSGQQFRLRDKGVPDLRGGHRGDQVVTVRVVIPTDLTSEQRALLAKLGETLGEPELGGEEHRRGFFGKVKDALGV